MCNPSEAGAKVHARCFGASRELPVRNSISERRSIQACSAVSRRDEGGASASEESTTLLDEKRADANRFSTVPKMMETRR